MVIIRFGVLPSISDSWYELQPKKQSYLFTFFIWGLAVPMFFVGTFWYALACGFLCFVGVATQFKEGGMTKVVHNWGAAGGIGLALLALLIEGFVFPLAFTLLGIAFVVKKKLPNKIWWIEIIAFVNIELALIIRAIIEAIDPSVLL